MFSFSGRWEGVQLMGSLNGNLFSYRGFSGGLLPKMARDRVCLLVF